MKEDTLEYWVKKVQAGNQAVELGHNDLDVVVSIIKERDSAIALLKDVAMTKSYQFRTGYDIQRDIRKQLVTWGVP